MRTKAEILSLLTDPGIIVVIRVRDPAHVLPAAEALLAGGVVAIEIAMSTPNAIALICELREKLGAQATIGVGTVLDADTCRAALEAGAEYVVTPVLRADLVPIVHAASRPIMLGAYSPTEIQVAHEAGSDLIKVFPADGLGPAYIKALRAPLPHLRLVPMGGVGVISIADYFNAGCAALGVGASVLSNDVLKRSDWAEVTRRASELVQAAREARRLDATRLY